MGIISQFFDFFKHKDVNKNTGAENDFTDDNISPLVVQANKNVSMVRVDNFSDSSYEPEEYTLRDEEVIENFSDDERDGGIVVEEGDDMSPIIMDEHEEIIVDSEKIDMILGKSVCDVDTKSPLNEIIDEDLEESEEIEIL